MKVNRRVFVALASALVTVVSMAGSTSLAASGPLRGASAPVCSAGTTVTTDDGPVCGVASGDITAWKGIRYAAPPVGDLRWAPPARPVPWTEPFAATTDGNACPQLPIVGTGSETEDCLNLTVRVPSDVRSESVTGRLPVMVQIHDGGFLLLQAQDASHLVTGGHVISVEVNYRLGIFGFLVHKALGEHSGDYGLQDQQAALRWVQRNIAKFGGDPHNVTIYGASAGGSSVCDHTVAPSSAGLFQRGISESGEYNSLLGVNTIWQAQDCMAQLPTEGQAQAAGARFATALGCSDVDAAGCLRRLPVATLLNQAGKGRDPDNGTVAPIINGTTLPMSPGEAFATGHVNHVALIHGVGRDETQLPSASTPADYDQLIAQQYGAYAPRVRDAYPLARFPAPAPFIAYRTIVADSNSVCPALLNDERMSRYLRVFAYDLDDTDIPTQFFVDPSKPNGAYHIAEDLLLKPPPDVQLNPNQQALSDQLVAQWTGFARTGDPTVDGAPAWEPFTHQHPVVMALNAAGDSQLTTETSRHHHCEQLWNRLAPHAGH